MTHGRLAGKVALITEAARGQGEAEARLFAAEGARVMLADVLDELGENVAAQIGDDARYTHLDVRDLDSWHAAVAATEAAFGAITVLVNNAGVVRGGTVLETTPEQYLDVIAVNQLGPMLGMQAVVPSMRRAGGGSIVNISSNSGLIGIPGSIAYTSSKWAVRGLTKSAALELAPDIRVNAILPGPVDTPMIHDPSVSAERFASIWDSVVPLGRAASPVEIAHAVLFLASDDSSFMTGSDVVVDGGRTTGTHRGVTARE